MKNSIGMRRIMRAIALLAVGLVSVSASAFNITLKAVEELDSLDLGDVKVSMLMKDSVAGSALTDGFGIAEIKNLAQGEYRLELQKEGFYPVAALVNLGGDADLGTFAMTSTSTVRLDELVVDGARIEQHVDKMTVRPLNETVASSINSFDLLRKLNLQGLNINPISGMLSIYGKPGVLQVDGIERSMDYVMALDPARIEKIEYTDNPSARYMQSGNGGIVNIILKRVEKGGSVYASGYVVPMTVNVGGNVMATYNHKDSQFSLSVDQGNSNIKKRAKSSTVTEIFKGDDGYLLERKSKSRVPGWGETTNLNLAYQYNNRLGWMLNVEAGASFHKEYGKTISEITTNGSDSFKGLLTQKLKSFTPSLNIYARKQSDSWKLEMIAGATFSDSHSTRDNTEDTPEGLYQTTRDLKSKSPTVKFEARFTRDLPNNIGEWEVGLRENYTHAHNDYGIYGLDKWDHSRTYGYASSKVEFGKFGAQVNLGLGYDHTASDYSKDNVWQPSCGLRLLYKFSREFIIMSNAAYAPSYPSMSQRSNIEDDVQPGVVSTGNDKLKTGHSILENLFFIYSKNNFNTCVSGSISHAIHPMGSYVDYRGDGEFAYIPYNLKNETRWFAQLDLGYDGLFNHLDIHGQLAYRVDRFNTGYGINRLKSLVPNIQITAYWGNFYIWANWYGAQPYLDGFDKERVSTATDISITYMIPHWKFQASISNIGYGHDGSHHRKTTRSPFYDSMSFTRTPFNGNRLTFSVAYDLQFGRSYQTRNKGLSGAKGEATTVKLLDATEKIGR